MFVVYLQISNLKFVHFGCFGRELHKTHGYTTTIHGGYIIMKKSQSSQYRTQICGLPPKLVFSPNNQCNYESNDDESHRHHQQEILMWKNQLREEELWQDAQSNTTCLLREIVSFFGQKDSGSSSILSDDLIQYFGRRIVASTAITDNTTEDINTVDTWLTIYDLEKIAQTLTDHSFATDGPNEFTQNSKYNIQEEAAVTKKSWYDVIIIPYEGAANKILKIYDKDTSKQHMQRYLNYRAMRTMEQVQYFTLPFQKKRILQLKQYYSKQQQLQNELELCYTDAFEKLDDYCMNTLGVESDTLPLFPVHTAEADVGDASAKIIDHYADNVARHVRNIMTEELEKISIRFLSFLEDNGKAISAAIEYYLQFTDFLSSNQWRDGQESANYTHEKIPTLKKFVTSSSDSLISQFIHLPSSRVMLVSDLQQLNSFLTTRKRELSSRVAGSGRDVVEAIDLAWTQHCITTASATSGCNLNALALDISQYISAVQNVLAQIVGNGLHAKRLRLLADVLGYSPTEEAFRFKMLCRRAACLAYHMSLYQSQKEASALTTERCKLDIDMKAEELRLDTCRLDMVKTMGMK